MGKKRNRKPIRSRRKAKGLDHKAPPDALPAQANEETAPRVQYGAIPFRLKDGGVEVMLLTSRETKRWVVPKGWPMKSRKPHAAAAREAYEEGGLVGEIGRLPIGSYTYDKRLKSRDTVPCRVELFPFEVRRQLKRWPEKGEREVRWFSPEEAAEAVDEQDLGTLIRQISASVVRPAKPS